jgi:aldose 1-epimerase
MRFEREILPEETGSPSLWIFERGFAKVSRSMKPIQLLILGLSAVLWRGTEQTMIAAENNSLTIEEREFGKTREGQPVHLFTLRNSKGMTIKIMTLGAIITELHAPDKNGNSTNVVLGFDNLESYLKGHPFFGAIAGRYANRIAGAKFSLDGREYTLAANNGRNHLHGGVKGFDKVLWQPTPFKNDQEVGVKLHYHSADGEEGYPGNLDVFVTYSLNGEGDLRIDYEARTDKATPINLTNHSYFNLAGGDGFLDQELMLTADKATAIDNELIPTGKIESVKGTPLDFTKPRTIGSRIKELKGIPGTYDHNFVLNDGGRNLALAARVREPKSGRVMEVLTTQPGIQLYTGNPKGFCLETQHFPDSVHQPEFPSAILRPGETFKSATILRFSAEK